MTDQLGAPRAKAHRAQRLEYKVFFVLIFMITLPFTLLGWALSPVLGGRAPVRGPVARALEEAGAITPMIFLA